MAEIMADHLVSEKSAAAFEGADMSTKLKLLGVDVASFGDAFATTPGALELVFADAVGGVYKKLVVLEKDEPEGGFVLLGGILVGDASAYGILRPMVSSGMTLPRSEEHTSELQSLMRISYAVFCLKKKKNQKYVTRTQCKKNTQLKWTAH